MQKGKRIWKTEIGAEQGIFKFKSASSYVSKEINFTTYNINKHV
jgi:hypothetical protein